MGWRISDYRNRAVDLAPHPIPHYPKLAHSTPRRSHSIVPDGMSVMSQLSLLIPRHSLMILAATRPKHGDACQISS